MKVLVTGAGGFLGRSVVRAAANAGHAVVAMVRPAAMPVADLPAGAEALVGDLRQMHAWPDSLGGIEAVIHCAAATCGDLPTQLASTVAATENLLSALPPSLVRFVHVSSFSVYDFSATGMHGQLTEATPLEADGFQRDGYTQAKLRQERVVRDFCKARGIGLVVARPGAIYGPGNGRDFGSALRVGPCDLVFAPLSRIPLVHVDNCADALVAALASDIPGEAIVNVVDDEQPRAWAYHRAARRAGLDTGHGIPVPYWAVRALGLLARIASVVAFRGRARLPELLDLPRQQARWRPLRYSNRAAREILGWRPRISLAEGIAGMRTDPAPSPQPRDRHS